jgi:hypothetical protein
MKKTRLFLIAFFVGFVSLATTAEADTTSTMNFTTTSGQAPTSGVIDCDSPGCPNSIAATIDWEGLSFTFSDSTLTSGLEPDSYFMGYPTCNAADGPSALAYQSLNMCSGYDGWATAELEDGSWVLALDSGTPGLFALETGVGTPDENAVPSGGSFTDPTSTPEPGSNVLMLTGLASLGLMLMRKRSVQHRNKAT